MKKAFAEQWHWSDGCLLSVSRSLVPSPCALYGAPKCVNDCTCTYMCMHMCIYTRIYTYHPKALFQLYISILLIDHTIHCFGNTVCCLPCPRQPRCLARIHNLGGLVADMSLSDLRPHDAGKSCVRHISETHRMDICQTLRLHSAICTCGMTPGSGERCMTSPPPVALSARWARRVASSEGVR